MYTDVYTSGYSNSSEMDFEDVKNDRLFPDLEGEISGRILRGKSADVKIVFSNQRGGNL